MSSSDAPAPEHRLAADGSDADGDGEDMMRLLVRPESESDDEGADFAPPPAPPAPRSPETNAGYRAASLSAGFTVEPRAHSVPPPSYEAATTPHLGPYGYSRPPGAHALPPPSFEESVAATPLSMRPSPHASYAPVPAVAQEVLVVRSPQGVFVLHPTNKPPPPSYAASASPPISPLPRYALPPATSAAPPAGHFLGPSAMHGAELPPYAAVTGGSPYLHPYTAAAVTPHFKAAPPPPYGA